jgi:hypothetical protein
VWNINVYEEFIASNFRVEKEAEEVHSKKCSEIEAVPSSENLVKSTRLHGVTS